MVGGKTPIPTINLIRCAEALLFSTRLKLFNELHYTHFQLNSFFAIYN